MASVSRQLVTAVLVGLATAVLPPALAAGQAATSPAGDGDKYLQRVREFADTVLRYGRDVYGPRHTPLFVDGMNVNTHEPAGWRLDGQEWVLSDLASQQNLFRTLDGLSRLTGDPKYHQAAVDATRYALDHLRSPNGLLYWGGHCAYDAATEQIVGEKHDRKNGGRYEHELKRHYPYYELMWAVDEQACRTFLESFWDAHILDWSNLEMNRHGSFTQARGALWKNRYAGGPVFFEARGLSFVNTGSDLFYAAALLHKLSGDPAPLMWAKRMARRYVETRNPGTGLGGYQYTRYAEGDRAKKQFGPEFGDRALEATLLTPSLGLRKFAQAGACQLMLGEMLGEEGREFTRWGLEDLTAYGRWAYSAKDNTFRALLTDGTILTPADVKRKGYFGPVNSHEFEPARAGLIFFRAYAMAFGLSGDPFLWQMARDIGRGNDLGDIGDRPDGTPHLNMSTTCSDPQALHGLLALNSKTGRHQYLDLARRIADSIVNDRFRNGLFVRSLNQRFAKFDADEPLALLHLVARTRGIPKSVPVAWPGKSYFHCRYDGLGRTYDNEAIYAIMEDAVE